jgi:chromosome segregation ATPase
LKIHFLEENLKKMGPEFNVRALEENINLKSEKVTMSRDIKQYSKDLKAAENELETYKQQLHEYADKVKRRHADAGMREEMDELRQLAEERAAEIERLEEKLAEDRSAEDELEKVSAELECTTRSVARRARGAD